MNKMLRVLVVISVLALTVFLTNISSVPTLSSQSKVVYNGAPPIAQNIFILGQKNYNLFPTQCQNPSTTCSSTTIPTQACTTSSGTSCTCLCSYSELNGVRTYSWSCIKCRSGTTCDPNTYACR